MYQIFVVEDELLIRQSIRNTIEKMQGPYSFCGEASDGEMALSIMQDLMPDILITDIRMPFLDGFGLIRHARSIMPWIRVIIISGYGDFEYARKAITMGVDRYLLKPVRPIELIKTVEEVAAQIEKDKQKTSMPGGFDPDEVQIALRKHFTQQLLYGSTEIGTLLEQARILKLDIIRSCYLVLVCQFESQDPDQALLVSTVHAVLTEMEQVLFYFNAADQLTVIVCDNDAAEGNERAYRLIQILKHELREICPVITAMIGTTVSRLGEIAKSHKHTLNCLKQADRSCAGQVLSTEDADQKQPLSSPSLKMPDEKYHPVISQAKAYVREHFCDPNLSLISTAEHVGMSSAHFSTLFSQQQGQTFISYLTQLRVERAKEMLLSTSLKLADIALEVGYNEPNYFSHVFRKVTGMTPKDFRSRASDQ
ncbi:MAG: helix-turn-helix domain-containing protein [Parasporobacterium sp.]|nr:helix-turn-helix domain-containing protein [Parasporobacterium sp.]